MRALLITNDFPPLTGGLTTWYVRMCTAIPSDQLVVLAPRFRGDGSFDARQPYRIIRASVPTSPNPIARLLQIVLLGTYAFEIVRRQHIKVVHIGHLHLGPIGLALRILCRTPYVLYLHGGEMAVYLRLAMVRRIVRTVVAAAKRVVVNSRYTQRYYEAMGLRLPHPEVLLMSVSLDRFRPDLDGARTRSQYGLSPEDKVILTVGRLVERKGHDVVLRALRTVQEAVGRVYYVIAGTGPEAERLQMLVCQMNQADRVIFAGHVPEDHLPSLYAASDVFVMPSRALAQRDGVEGFGLVFLEAAACGKPVIGGRSGGVGEAVIDGVTGLLIEPTDVDGLAEALIFLLNHPQEAACLGRHGRRRVETLEAAWARTLRKVWNS